MRFFFILYQWFEATFKTLCGSFNWCGGLNELEIPSTVKQIAGGCFAGCSNLSNINIKQAENAISGAPWGAAKGMKVINWNR